MSEDRFEYEVMREWEYDEESERVTGLELDNDPAYQEWLTKTLKEDLEWRMNHE